MINILNAHTLTSEELEKIMTIISWIIIGIIILCILIKWVILPIIHFIQYIKDEIDYRKIEKERKERQKQIEKLKDEKKIEKLKQDFYNEQLERCTKCEKVYYETLYKKYSDKYTIKAQVFLRSMYAGYGAENHKIDIVFFNKQTDKPELLIEINDYTHKDLLRKARDKDLKEFCNINKIKLQFLYTKYGCTPKSIYRVIDKKLQE